MIIVFILINWSYNQQYKVIKVNDIKASNDFSG